MIIRVLHVYPQLNNAGTEMVIMNLYRNIDKNKVQFDFLVEKPGELDSMITQLGGRIYYIEYKKKKEYYSMIFKFLISQNEYNIVHTHTHRKMGLVLKAARKSGIKCRIAHSHNARLDLPKVFALYKRITGREIEKSATDFFACSTQAARWLFPTKYQKCSILYNGIELQRFNYNEDRRLLFRKAYGIGESTKVVCHVGRFAKEKNHNFILEIARELRAKDPLIKFIFVGSGPLKELIEQKTNNYQLMDNFIFLGNRTDVNDILSASDLFILPSLHEGLGMVLIEAQTNGLNCIASDMVPAEADIGIGLLERKQLSDGPLSWANSVFDKIYKFSNRRELSDNALSTHYDIKKTANYIQEYYLGIN